MTDRQFAIGVDIGGTFTDCLILSTDGRQAIGKVATTPKDRSIGFFDSIEEAASRLGLSSRDVLGQCSQLIHGTTTGTNALVQRAGARVGLVATAGHGDSIRIMKGSGRTAGLDADRLMDLVGSGPKPEPLVSHHLTVEVQERIDVDGDIVIPLNEDAAREQIAWLVDQGIESLAVSLLWSVKDPVHEHRVREIAKEVAPHLFMSCSSDIVARIGEYERTVACVMNAYIGPCMVEYIDRIEDGAAERGYVGPMLYTHCAGGAMNGDEARRLPLLTFQSGPVAGVMQSCRLATELERPSIITSDMGGTTFDVSVIRDSSPLTRDLTVIDKYEVAMPMLDIESIGAGGGSIAWLDESRRLNVGPQSAGADPGPACYGKGGTAPTVTDADVILGLISPDRYLHGAFDLDVDRAFAAISELGAELGLDVYQTAAGINQIVDSKMADLLRRMVEYRGMDPRKFALLAFGGGGPVHAAACARYAGIPEVIIALPGVAPIWSAAGAACSNVVHVYFESLVVDLPAHPDALETVFRRLEERGRSALLAEGFDESEIVLSRSLRMRYKLQVYDVEVPLEGQLESAADVDALDGLFLHHYEERFGEGSAYREGGMQTTAFQVRASESTLKAQPRATSSEGETDGVPQWLRRQVYWAETRGFVETPVLRLDASTTTTTTVPDDLPVGPLLIEAPDTVIVVPPGQRASYDGFGNIVIETSGASRAG